MTTAVEVSDSFSQLGRLTRSAFKHFDLNGYEACSGRDGWSKRKTTNKAEVTCKNCLRAIAKLESPK